jgi:aspartate/methionine/tyrosine aminotransferase
MRDEELEPRRVEFERRRDAMLRRLRALDGVTSPTPEGAFYAFPNFSAYLGRKAGSKTIADASDLAQFLLEKAKVAVVTGAAFGAPQ